MSSVVKEPTFILGYNFNVWECGLYEWDRSLDKVKMAKKLEKLEKMSPSQRAMVFDCTEAQAKNMKMKLISIYPYHKSVITDEDDTTVAGDNEEKDIEENDSDE